MLHLVTLLTLICILTLHISFAYHTNFGITSVEERLRFSQEEESTYYVTNVQSTAAFKPANCIELKQHGYTKSGLYTIYPRLYAIYPRFWYNVLPFDVYCDMHTDGGGWTVIQRRDNYGGPDDNFYRTWAEYKDGFGLLSKDFWLGNDRISVLTTQDRVALRFDLEDFDGQKRYASYDVFEVAPASQDYKLTVSSYIGDAGDSFSDLNGVPFVTHDKNDANNCSATFKGGWWYTNCHTCNPNGLYLKGKHESYANGINWKAWHGYHYSLKRTEIKIRPLLSRPQ